MKFEKITIENYKSIDKKHTYLLKLIIVLLTHF